MEEALRRAHLEEQAGERRRMLVNFGPQHPSTHGVLRVLLTLEGETVIDAQPDIGYLHRNWEKIVEGWTYAMVVPFSDRNDYLAAICNEQAVVGAVERLMGIEVPERGQFLRVLVFELQRLTSHLIWFGTFAMDMGATTAFLHAFRERERCYSLFEEITGARLLYNYLRIGGLRNDVPDSWLKKLEQFLDDFEKEAYPSYWDLVINNEIFRVRTKGIGVITPEQAIAYGASGPVLRGSGIRWDLRKVDPFLPYDQFEFDIPVGTNGDAYDRAIVRMKEMMESVKIIRQVMKRLPDGPVMAKLPRALRPPKGQVYNRVESPRGEVGVYLISDGGTGPYRIKWRSPCFTHLMLLPVMARGHLVADLVTCIGSIDIVLGEVDR
ncbi:MAG: NADH-quinone oxidoreductase subunit D [Bacillota bacterium]|nr:NADH-quinone oxidoreductase subunit NuoD [Bacillota bacterium]REJ35318.1 MAG: NADH-quinone oxidoreductase subunit D [Bacillota bacterium]